jgi:hypothetical protein
MVYWFIVYLYYLNKDTFFLRYLKRGKRRIVDFIYLFIFTISFHYLLYYFSPYEMKQPFKQKNQCLTLYCLVEQTKNNKWINNKPINHKPTFNSFPWNKKTKMINHKQQTNKPQTNIQLINFFVMLINFFIILFIWINNKPIFSFCSFGKKKTKIINE